ncbi:hypothetical protein EA1_03385 [Moraxella catarrhalis O35E]|nr:hypothetical protein EA1_03385 [Moraxella catarrhalis O35E]
MAQFRLVPFLSDSKIIPNHSKSCDNFIQQIDQILL